MVITKPKLAVILVTGVLLSIASTFVGYRIALYLLFPQAGVSVECFDILPAGMSRDLALAVVRPEQPCKWSGPDPRKGRRVERLDDNGLEIELIFNDGILTDGTATVNGQVVRRHLQPRDPVLGPVRLGLRQLEATFIVDQPFEPFSYLAALMASIAMVMVLDSARQPRAR